MKQYLWFLTRENMPDQKLVDKMMEISKASLPNFDFTMLAARDYQGPKCNYESVAKQENFLQWFYIIEQSKIIINEL